MRPSRAIPRRLGRAAFDHGQPIARPDTLPILLFTLCLAASVIAMGGHHQHAVLIDLPAPLPPDFVDKAERLPAQRLGLSARGTILWNGSEVSLSDLQERLAALAAEPVARPLQFDPAPDAAYGDVALLLGVVGKAGLIDTCFRFMGAEKYRDYDSPPDMDAPEPDWTTSCSWDMQHSMPRIIEPKPNRPVDYFIW